jgi:hypothetical protein
LFPSSIHSYVLPPRASFFAFSNLAASLCTSFPHLFLGFLTGLLTARLSSRIRFVVGHPYYMSSPLQSFNKQVRYAVSVCTVVRCTIFSRRHYLLRVQMFSEGVFLCKEPVTCAALLRTYPCVIAGQYSVCVGCDSNTNRYYAHVMVKRASFAVETEFINDDNDDVGFVYPDGVFPRL